MGHIGLDWRNEIQCAAPWVIRSHGYYFQQRADST